jgi:hypothetical protein
MLLPGFALIRSQRGGGWLAVAIRAMARTETEPKLPD